MAKKMMMLWMVTAILMIMAACSSGTQSSNITDPNAAPTNEKKGQKAETKVGGVLNFYTSQPDADAEKLVNAFNSQYPDVQVNVFRSGTEEVISKLQAEKQAGSIQADLLLVADAVTFKSLKEQDLLLSYQSKEHDAIPGQFVDPDYTYTGTKIISTALAVNTDKVSEVPDSWQVLASDAAKGEAVMPSPLYSGAAAYNLGVLTRTKGFGWDFYQALSENDMMVTKGNGAALKAVASGEKSYAMVVEFIVARAEQEGSPVKLVYPKEGVPAITEPVGILKNTDNKPAAKAFVDFILSEQGQKMQAEIGYTPIRSGIKAPKGLKSIDELKVLDANLEELYQARSADKQQFTEVFGE